MPRKEIRPTKEIVSKINREVIIPLHQQLEDELSCYLTTIVAIDVNGLLGPKIGIKFDRKMDADRPNIHGEVRLRFRETFVEGRLLYNAEGVYTNLHPNGFSGFNTVGEVLVSSEDILIKPKGWTKRYNVWDWQGWV